MTKRGGPTQRRRSARRARTMIVTRCSGARPPQRVRGAHTVDTSDPAPGLFTTTSSKWKSRGVATPRRGWRTPRWVASSEVAMIAPTAASGGWAEPARDAIVTGGLRAPGAPHPSVKRHRRQNAHHGVGADGEAFSDDSSSSGPSSSSRRSAAASWTARHDAIVTTHGRPHAARGATMSDLEQAARALIALWDAAPDGADECRHPARRVHPARRGHPGRRPRAARWPRRGGGPPRPRGILPAGWGAGRERSA